MERQFSFPFLLETAEDYLNNADKITRVEGTNKFVCQNTPLGVWVVAEGAVPVLGPSGRVIGRTIYTHKGIFYKGEEAWEFAEEIQTPFIHIEPADVLARLYSIHRGSL